MSKKVGSAQSGPAPKTPEAKRLEHVRKIRGVRSLSEFWRRLVKEQEDGDSFSVSYAAARNYHYDRSPPAAYLVRVAEVYDIRLSWLLTGDGEPTEMDELIRREREVAEGELTPIEKATERIVTDRLRSEFVLYDELAAYAKTMVWQAITVVGSDIYNRTERDGSHPEYVETGAATSAAAGIVGKSLAGPLLLLPGRWIDPDALDHYAVAMCQALMHACTRSPDMPNAGDVDVEESA